MDFDFSNSSIELLKKLISIKSEYFMEDEIMEFVNKWCADNGLNAYIHTYTDDKITHFSGKNVVITIDSKKSGKTIFLNGHLDTVKLCNGWTKDPYKGIIEGDKLYGVGALDMKGGCAEILIALKAFKESNLPFTGKIIATLASDEEGPFGLGSNYIIEDGIADNIDVSIVTEPNAGFIGVPFPTICLGARGGYGVSVEFFGKSAHGANPQFGISAAVDAAKVICELEKTVYAYDEHLGHSNNCIIKIEADGGACSVPDYSKVSMFRHIVPGETKQTIINEIETAIKNANIKCTYNIIVRESPTKGSDGFLPYKVDKDNFYVQKLQETIRETINKEASYSYFQSMGDFNYFGTRVGAPCILFGASGKNYHSHDEYIDIPSHTETTKILYNYLVKLLSEA